jgi:hypothetical protein
MIHILCASLFWQKNAEQLSYVYTLYVSQNKLVKYCNFSFLDSTKQSLKLGFTPINPSIHPPTKSSSAVNQQFSTSNLPTPVQNPVQFFIVLVCLSILNIAVEYQQIFHSFLLLQVRGTPIPCPYEKLTFF